MLAAMEQSAVTYRVRDKLIVGSVVRTSMGVGVEVNPRRLSIKSQAEEIAAAIDCALEGAGGVITHPAQDQWKGLFKPFLQAAGVRSYKAFMEEAISVEITRRGELLELNPQRNLGGNGGFAPIRSETVVLPASDLMAAAFALKSFLNRNGS